MRYIESKIGNLCGLRCCLRARRPSCPRPYHQSNTHENEQEALDQATRIMRKSYKAYMRKLEELEQGYDLQRRTLYDAFCKELLATADDHFVSPSLRMQSSARESATSHVSFDSKLIDMVRALGDELNELRHELRETQNQLDALDDDKRIINHDRLNYQPSLTYISSLSEQSFSNLSRTASSLHNEYSRLERSCCSSLDGCARIKVKHVSWNSIQQHILPYLNLSDEDLMFSLEIHTHIRN